MPQRPAAAELTVTVVRDRALARRTPLVSVCIVTYNQASYIGAALDSALAQETDFDYEIIVGDDCSTDGTRAVLEAYQRDHPGQIRLHLHEEHYEGIPARKNMLTNLRAARGRYVALLDGDDYWISTDKLQRQARLMEERPEVVFSFHDARVVRNVEPGEPAWATGCVLGDAVARASRTVSLHELLPPDKCSVPAPSVMYRRALFEPVPPWFQHVLSADRAMQLHLVQQGAAYYHHDLLAVWRKHSRSLTASRAEAIEALLLKEIPVFSRMCPPFRPVARHRRASVHGRHAGRRRQEMRRHWQAGRSGCALRKLWAGGVALLHHLYHRLRLGDHRYVAARWKEGIDTVRRLFR
jgi:glycosyltransferase involved in cell wall biosynthesis